MNISATLALWGCMVLGVLSLGGAYAAYASMDILEDPAEREAMLTYVWFALFVFVVAAALGVACWMIRTGRLGKS